MSSIGGAPLRGTDENQPLRRRDVAVFGAIELRPIQRRVLLRGQEVVIGARSFDVLLALVERRGRVVPKQALLEAVWPGQIVEDSNVFTQVSTLRRMLGPDVIVTVPGRGYQFVAGSPQLEADPRPPAAADAPAPAAPEALIDREAELDQLRAILGTRRLVSIIGAGGVGKSVLARQALHRMAPGFANGAAWIDLAALGDAGGVAAAVARTMGLSMGMNDPVAALTKALASQEALIVLDNAESVLEETAAIAEALLLSTQRIWLLVTTQARLGLADEHLLRLEPLAVPPAGTPASAALDFSAVQLFVRRLEATGVRVALDEAALEAAMAVARGLDGLPLALELAAARVPMLGVPGVAAALNDRLRMLGSDRHPGPLRQRTLRAALEWSYGLLTESQQKVLRRLAVFAGAFVLETAQAVAVVPEEGFDAWDVADRIGELIDRSLVAVEEGEPRRYRLLDSTRLYAAHQLQLAGELESTSMRHAAAMLDRFERGFLAVWRDEEPVERHTPPRFGDVDDALNALRWAVEHAPERAVAMVPCLAVFLRDFRTISELFESTDALVADAPPLAQAGWYTLSAWLRARMLPAIGLAHALRAADMARANAPAWLRCGALLSLAIAQTAAGAETGGTLEELRAVEEHVGLGWRAEIAWIQGMAHQRNGDGPGAEQAFQKMLRLAVDDGQLALELRALRSLAGLAVIRGEHDAAIGWCETVVARLPPDQFPAEWAVVLLLLSVSQLAKGRLADATSSLRRQLTHAFRSGAALADTGDHLAQVAVRLGQWSLAARFIGWVDGLRMKMGTPVHGALVSAAAQARSAVAERLPEAELERERTLGAAMTETAVRDAAVQMLDSIDAPEDGAPITR